MSNLKRYAVTLDFFIWVESDEEAIITAESFAKSQDEKKDDRCKVVSIHDTSVTSLKPRKIK